MQTAQLTSKITKAKSQANLAKLFANHKIASAGSGLPIWIVNMDEFIDCNAIIRVKDSNNTVYLRTEPVVDKNGAVLHEEAHIPLGQHYEAIQTFVDDKDELLPVRLATRKPNLNISEEALERIADAYGKDSLRLYYDAIATGNETLILMSYLQE